MILKASQRGGGQNLAVHLMRTDENEHVSLHEIRGFASESLSDAFREAEAVSLGTKCRQYLFSVSFSPPSHERVPVAVFEEAIDRVETRLGLSGQPRAIVFHEKDGRRHAHCVWSRIDADTMTACQMSFFKTKLMGISRDLYLENGWKLPQGIAHAGQRNPTNFSLAEWQQFKRIGTDPRALKESVQCCWQKSDNLRSFTAGLQEQGLFLAKGDRRGFVVVDYQGEVFSLPRMLGLKVKEVRARFGEGNDLSSVETTRSSIEKRMTPAIRRHIADSQKEFQKRSSVLGNTKERLTLTHRQERISLDQRHRSERDVEAKDRAAKLPKGLRGLWDRITGRFQQTHRELEDDARRSAHRQVAERDTLVARQLDQREVLQKQFKELRALQARRLLELRKDIGRFLRFKRDAPAQPLKRSPMQLRLEP